MNPSSALLLFLLLTATAATTGNNTAKDVTGAANTVDAGDVAATGNTAKDGAAAAAEQTGAVNPATDGAAAAAAGQTGAVNPTDPTAVAPVAQPQGGGKPTDPAPEGDKPATKGPEPAAPTPGDKIEPKPATDVPPPTAPPQPKVTPAPTTAEATSTSVTRSTPTPPSREELDEMLIKCPMCWLTIREMDAIITSIPKFDNDHFAKMITNRCKMLKTKALKISLAQASKAGAKRPLFLKAADHCAELSQASANIYLAAIDTHMRLSAQHICADELSGWCQAGKVIWYANV
ncbi:hypothetical protein PRIPAC_94500 [Pristionchus pacificus]|uniref:Uncharacterized protein n=1 Tax=Pristionchus pacificus TaxID=54126 RepID=A0A2A6CEB3_PRIPA|nr:hypothetical protein PRIPAC_94500 [Pristionchus pacificus]|eukprot:PDM76446.1 hypothetical protein PRIPAC_40050 [Pristionchus pacificus]